MNKLDECLAEMEKYARPRVSMSDKDTWSCVAKLRIQVKGGEFEIRSEFGHATALSAARECFSRVIETVNTASELKRPGNDAQERYDRITAPTRREDEQ